MFFSRGIVNMVYGAKKKLEKISIGTVWRGGGVVGVGADAPSSASLPDSDAPLLSEPK